MFSVSGGCHSKIIHGFFRLLSKSLNFQLIKMRILLLLCLLGIGCPAKSSDFRITISGSFPGAQGQSIRLLEYSDQVSYLEKEIESVVADEAGFFEISFSMFEPQYVFFRIDHARMGMFVEPGNNYELNFDPVDFTLLDDTRNPYLDPWYFPFTIEEPQNDLNHHINKFDSIFESFLYENFAIIHRTRNRQLFVDFKLQADSIFADVENEYFRNYYEYKFAGYFRTGNIERFENLVRKYILNQPVLYENTQYMNFFNSIFDTYIFSGSRQISINDLRHTINNLNSYPALMDSLGKDTILRNEVLRELVMLKTLQDVYNNPDYSQRNVIRILNDVATQSKFPQHRAIAGNILLKSGHLTPGVAAPSFVLEDFFGKKFTVPDDFTGKFIYLEFWASWCETCQLDKIAMRELYQKYKDNFVFVSVSADRNKDAARQYLQNNPDPWQQLYFEGDFRLLDNYGVKSLPLFVLIDPEGKIISYPALRPGDNIAPTFERLLFQYR
jgi:thiol-disulfide isomerase/thioredoxin